MDGLDLDDLVDAADLPPPDEQEGGDEGGPSAPSTVAEHEGAGVPTSSSPTLKHVRIVKCALRRALALPDADYVKFSAAVEEYVAYVSQALRRASLALLRHLLHVAATGGQAPDLFRAKDVYWRNWLRLATQGAENVAQLPGVQDVMDKLGAPPPVPDVGTLDQVVAYAAITFKTAVCNNAYVPLIPRLTRLVKTALRARNQHDPHAGVPRPYDVVLHLREKNPTYDGWPDWLRAFATDVRDRLGLMDTDYLHDEWGKKMEFHRLFAFNVWMQHQFEALGARRISLSPVFNVQRAHVRLDKKVLVGLFRQLYPDHAAVKGLLAINKLHKEAKAKKEAGFLHPDKVMRVPRPMTKKKAACKDDGEWADQNELREEYERQVAGLRRSPAYVAQLRKNRLLVDAVKAVTGALFARIPVPKSGGWTFDGSVVTDGVSVSLQYSVMRPKPPAVKKRKARRAVARAAEYDRDLATYLPKLDATGGGPTLVVGVDPGRVNIATISYVLNDGATKLMKAAGPHQGSWTLSRGEYRTRSGILALDAAKVERCAPFTAQWASLGQDGASLRTSQLEDMDRYLDRLAEFERAWWEMALKRRESRDALRRYAGKRAVLDKFFAGVKKRLRRMFPDTDIQVGYGSAVMSMKPTGRGEVAVPTTGAFHACKRAFGPSAVSITDEANTTKKEWATGAVKQAVYATFHRDAAGVVRRTLGHTPCQWTPVVPMAERADVELEVGKLRETNRRRRGGLTAAPTAAAAYVPAVAPASMLRYPEVRGLRFSPERRMYLDRDREAARTIARLRTQELLGLDRPAPFCRGAA